MKVNPPAVPVENRRIVSLTQAAQYCGVSRSTMCGWIRRGELPAIRFPGRSPKAGGLRGVKVDLDDVDQFIVQAKERPAVVRHRTWPVPARTK